MGAVLCTGSASAETTATVFPDLLEIQKRGSLIAARPAGEFPPFFTRAGGSANRPMAGIDVELVESIARALNVDVEWRAHHPNGQSVVEAVSRGEADIGIGNLGITMDALEMVFFSDPYASFSMALLVDRNLARSFGWAAETGAAAGVPEAAIRRLGCPVAVRSHGVCGEMVRVILPDAKMVPYEAADDLPRLLASGRAGAALGDDLGFRLLTRANPDLALYFQILEIPGHRRRIAIAINPQASHLVPVINEAVARIRAHAADQLHQALQEAPPGGGGPAGTPQDAATEIKTPFTTPGAISQSPTQPDGAFPGKATAFVGFLWIVLAITWVGLSKPGRRLSAP